MKKNCVKKIDQSSEMCCRHRCRPGNSARTNEVSDDFRSINCNNILWIDFHFAQFGRLSNASMCSMLIDTDSTGHMTRCTTNRFRDFSFNEIISCTVRVHSRLGRYCSPPFKFQFTLLIFCRFSLTSNRNEIERVHSTVNPCYTIQCG